MMPFFNVSYACHICVIRIEKQTILDELGKEKTLENTGFTRVLGVFAIIWRKTGNP